MKKLYQILNISQAIFIGLIFCTSFCVSEVLMQGIQMGKFFCFTGAMSVFIIITCLKYFFASNKQEFSIRLNILDVLIIIWLFYITIRLYYTPYASFNNERYIAHVLLTVFYFILKHYFVGIINNETDGTINKSESFEIHSTTLFQSVYFKILLIVLLLTGFTQAIIGMLQLYSVLPSYHTTFKITGMFFNPGPYSGYLAIIFPLAFGCVLFVKKNNLKNNIIYYISLSTVLAILLVIPAARSRASWLAILVSSCILLFYRYKNKLITQFLDTRFKKIGAIAAFSIGFIIAGVWLFQLKKESSNGRLFIWKLSTQMIMQKPIFGTGYGRFNADYNRYQAAYFAQQKENAAFKEAEVQIAGTGEYAFNEYIQTVVETGIFGLILFFAIISIPFIVWQRQTHKDKIYLIIVCSLFSVLIFAMFSYPFSMVAIFMLLFTFLSIISACISNRQIHRDIKITQITKVLRYAFLIALIVVSGFLMKRTQQKHTAFKQWKIANDYLLFGAYGSSSAKYEEIMPYLYHYPLFMHQYGKSLVLGGETEKGIKILEEAKEICTDPYLYNTLGDAYKQLKEYEKAEQAYSYACNIIPNKFYPLYLLAQLYDEMGEKEKAAKMAELVMNKKVKVFSPAIRDMKEGMKKLLEY